MLGASSDAERVRQVLASALMPAVEALLQRSAAPDPPDAEWEAVADQLVETLAEVITPETPILPDYAMSRAGIYEEHP